MFYKLIGSLIGVCFSASAFAVPAVVDYETERAIDDIERISHIRSVDIIGQNIYDIELPDGVNGVEPTWSPKLL